MKSDGCIQIARTSPARRRALANVRGGENAGLAESGNGVTTEKEIFRLAKP
jgi:hypothetical protein